MPFIHPDMRIDPRDFHLLHRSMQPDNFNPLDSDCYDPKKYQPFNKGGVTKDLKNRVASGSGVSKKTESIKDNSKSVEKPEPIPQQLPLKITDIYWRHIDETRKSESPDKTKVGDVLQLNASFENYIDGAGVDFFIYLKTTNRTQSLKKIHTQCKDMSAVAEWEVDVSQSNYDEFEIKFYCIARDLKSDIRLIPLEEIEDHIISVPFSIEV